MADLIWSILGGLVGAAIVMATCAFVSGTRYRRSLKARRYIDAGNVSSMKAHYYEKTLHEIRSIANDPSKPLPIRIALIVEQINRVLPREAA